MSLLWVQLSACAGSRVSGVKSHLLVLYWVVENTTYSLFFGIPVRDTLRYGTIDSGSVIFKTVTIECYREAGEWVGMFASYSHKRLQRPLADSLETLTTLS